MTKQLMALITTRQGKSPTINLLYVKANSIPPSSSEGVDFVCWSGPSAHKSALFLYF